MVESTGGSTSGTTGSWALGCSLFRCRPCKWIWTIRQLLQSCDQKRFLHLTTVIVVTASFIRQHLENMGRHVAVRTGFDIQCKQQDAHFSKQFLRYLCQMWYEGTGDANGYSPSWHFCGKILARHSSTLPSPFVSNSQPPDTSLHAKGAWHCLNLASATSTERMPRQGTAELGSQPLRRDQVAVAYDSECHRVKLKKAFFFLAFPSKPPYISCTITWFCCNPNLFLTTAGHLDAFRRDADHFRTMLHRSVQVKCHHLEPTRNLEASFQVLPEDLGTNSIYDLSDLGLKLRNLPSWPFSQCAR